MEFSEADIAEIRALATEELYCHLEIIRAELPTLSGEELEEAKAWAALYEKELNRRWDMGY